MRDEYIKERKAPEHKADRSITLTKEQFDEWIGLFHRLIDLYDMLCEQQKKNDEHFDNMIALCKGQAYSNGELIDILNNILDEREDI